MNEKLNWYVNKIASETKSHTLENHEHTSLKNKLTTLSLSSFYQLWVENFSLP